jgi:hypothetical protein
MSCPSGMKGSGYCTNTGYLDAGCLKTETHAFSTHHKRFQKHGHGECFFCLEDVNCHFKHDFFLGYANEMYKCPLDEYSADHEMECHRNLKDYECPAGYQEIITKTDFDDLKKHYQVKAKQCIEVGTDVD